MIMADQFPLPPCLMNTLLLVAASLRRLTLLLFPSLIVLTFMCPALRSQTATINISTSSPETMKRGLTGFNNGDYRTAYDLSVDDYIDHIDDLNIGWWRWYSGTVTNAFNWQRGTFDSEKKAQVVSKKHFLQYEDFANHEALRGHTHLKETYDLISALGLRLLITVNAVTSTVEEIEDLVKYCFDHGIKVDAWELNNEPELWAGEGEAKFFRDAEDYLDKMEPFNDAIKAKFPDAMTYVYYSTRPFGGGQEWNEDIKAYQTAHGRYWDGVAFHSYDGANADDTFDKKRLSANESLLEFDDKIEEYLDQSWSTAPLITTELNTRIQTAGGFWFTLYDGIYLAEVTLRMSNWDNFELIGRSRTTPGLIAPVHDFEQLIDDRAENGAGYNANSIPHDLYFSAAGYATSLVDEVINISDTRLTTTVTDSQQVSYKNAGGSTMDALYAQAYGGKNGQTYLCITNKSDTAQTVNVQVNGSAVSGGTTINLKTLADTDPETNNTPASPTTIVPSSTTSSGGTGISIPAYAVVQLTWEGTAAAPTLDAPRVYHREVGLNQLTLDWQPVDEADGYRVSCVPTGNAASPVDVGNVITHTVTSLTDQVYDYQVTPYYINGSMVKVDGTPSAVESIGVSAPGNPNITARPIHDKMIEVTWASKLRSTEYLLTYGPTGGTMITDQPMGAVTSFILTDCTASTEYTFTVKAKNGMGVSPSPKTTTVTYPAYGRSVPWAGVNLQATSISSSSVSLEWELPISLRQAWYFENTTDDDDWLPADAGTIARISHPDNSTTLGSPATPIRDTHGLEADASSTLARALADGTSDDDYLVTAWFEADAWTGDEKAWIFARHTGANYWYRFGYDHSDKTYYLQKKNGAGNKTTLASIPGVELNNSTADDGTPSSYAPPLRMNLGIRVLGNRIIPYLNQASLPSLEATDSTHSSGQIGFTASNVVGFFDHILWYDSHMESGTFEVWRSTSPTSGFTLRGTTSAGATSYTDSVSSGNTYYYKLRGLKASLESRDYSNTRTVVVP